MIGMAKIASGKTAALFLIGCAGGLDAGLFSFKPGGPEALSFLRPLCRYSVVLLKCAGSRKKLRLSLVKGNFCHLPCFADCFGHKIPHYHAEDSASIQAPGEWPALGLSLSLSSTVARAQDWE